MNDPILFATAQRLLEAGQTFSLITLIGCRGSTPQDLGSKMLVTEQGYLYGTIGGGKIEQTAIQTAQSLLQNQSKVIIKEWNLQKDIGMTCGGSVTLVFEQFLNNLIPMTIFGAGHVVQVLVPYLLKLGFRLTVRDSRADWLNKLPQHPLLTTKLYNEIEFQSDEISDANFVVIATMGHATDLPILKKLLQTTTEYPYIGVIGSKSKRGVLERELQAAAVLPEKIKSFHCPIGLNLGGNNLDEIAISVCAQILMIRDEYQKKTI